MRLTLIQMTKLFKDKRERDWIEMRKKWDVCILHKTFCLGFVRSNRNTAPLLSRILNNFMQ